MWTMIATPKKNQKDRDVFPGWYMFPLNFRVCNFVFFFFTIYFGFAVIYPYGSKYLLRKCLGHDLGG